MNIINEIIKCLEKQHSEQREITRSSRVYLKDLPAETFKKLFILNANLLLSMKYPNKEFVIEPGMRIAQMVIQKTYRARIIETEDLSQTVRGEGGFGHTGKK